MSVHREHLPLLIRMAVESLLMAHPITQMSRIEQKADQLIAAICPPFFTDIQRMTQTNAPGRVIGPAELPTVRGVALKKLRDKIEIDSRKPPLPANTADLVQEVQRFNMLMDALNQTIKALNEGASIARKG
jgi:hypothetical protein